MFQNNLFNVDFSKVADPVIMGIFEFLVSNGIDAHLRPRFLPNEGTPQDRVNHCNDFCIHINKQPPMMVLNFYGLSVMSQENGTRRYTDLDPHDPQCLDQVMDAIMSCHGSKPYRAVCFRTGYARI